MSDDLISRIKTQYPEYANKSEDEIATEAYARTGAADVGIDKNTFYKDILGIKPPGFGKEFGKGLSKSMADIKTLATKGAPSAVLSGADKLLEDIFQREFNLDEKAAEFAAKAMQELELNEQAYPRQIPTRHEVQDLESGMQYAGALMGQGLGSNLELIPGAIMTGGLTALAQGGVKTALKHGLKNAAKEFGTDLTDNQVEQQLIKGTFGTAFRGGAKAGFLGGSVAAETGSTYLDLLREGKDAPGVSIAAGLIKGYLEVLPEAAAATRLFKNPVAKEHFKNQVTKNVFKKFGMNIVKETGKISVAEGLTEAAQQAIDIAARDFVFKENTNLFSPENIDSLIEASLAGFIGAAPIGVIAGTAQAVKPDVVNAEFNHDNLIEEVIEPTAKPATKPTADSISVTDDFTDVVDVLQDFDPKQLEKDVLQSIHKKLQESKEFDARIQETVDKISMTDLSKPDANNITNAAIQEQLNLVGGELRGDNTKELPLPAPQPKTKVLPVNDVKLPKQLASAKPKHKYASRDIELDFENDISKALYIAGSKQSSASKQKYVDFLTNLGVAENDIPVFREWQRKDINSQAKELDTARVKLPPALRDQLGEQVEVKPLPKTQEPIPNYVGKAPRLIDTNPALYDNVVDNLRFTNLKDPAKFEKTMQEIQRTVERIAGKAANVQFYSEINKITGEKSPVEGGAFAEPLRGAQWGNTIAIAVEFNSTLGYSNNETKLHETFHFLYENSLNQKDKEIILANKEKLSNYVVKELDVNPLDIEHFNTEEIAATAFGLWSEQYLKNKNPNIGTVQRVFKKLGNILKGIRDALRKNNVKSIEDLFTDIAEGKRAVDAINTLVEDNRIARLQEVVVKAHISRDTKNLDAPQMDLITADKSKKMLGDRQGPPMEWSNSQNFINTVFRTSPGLAAVDNIWAVIHGIKHSEEQNLNILDSIVIKQMHDLFKDSQRLVNAAGVIDYLNTNEISMREDSQGRLVYKRDGKLQVLNAQTSQDVKDMSNTFKKVLRLWKDTSLEKLREIEGFNSVEEAITAQQDILNNPSDTAHSKDARKKAEKRLRDLEELKETFTLIDNKIKSSIPYFPRMAVGEWGVKLVRKDDPSVEVEQGFAIIRSDFNGRPSSKEFANVKDRWVKELGYDPKLYKVTEPFKLNRVNLTRALQGSDTKYNLEILASLMSSANPQLVDEIQATMKDLGGEVAKAKIERHFLERNNTLLYSKDYQSTIPAYFSSATRSINRFRYAETNAAIKEFIDNGSIPTSEGKVLTLDDKQQKLYKKYFDYLNNSSTDMAGLRAFNFFWAMGLNVSTALLQLVTLPVQVVSMMNTYHGNPISNNARVVKNFGLVTNMIIKTKGDVNKFSDITFLKKYLPDDIAEAVKIANDRNVFRPARMDDMAGSDTYSSGKAGGNYWSPIISSAKNVMGKPIQIAEETSRITSFISLYETLKLEGSVQNLEKNYSNGNHRYSVYKEQNENLNPAILASIFLIEDTHGMFGKIGRGANQQGVFGSLIFPFMQHPLMMMGLLGRLAGGNVIAKEQAVYTILATMAIAGLYGVPGWELWKALYELVHKTKNGFEIDLHHEIKKAMVTSEFMSPRVAETLTDGPLKSFLEIDVAKRVSIPFFFQNALMPLMQGKDGIDNFTGVAGSQLTNLTNVASAAASGEMSAQDALINSLAPVAFRNMYKAAVVYPTQGVRTARGTQIMTPDELSPSELISKFMGLQPSQISREYEKRNIERLGIVGWRNGYSKIVNKIANTERKLIDSDNSAERKKLEEELKELNLELVRFAKSVGKPIDKNFWSGVRESKRNHYRNAHNPDIPTKRHKTVEYDILEMLYERD